MAAKRKVYWDSCAWLGLINEEPDKVDSCRHVIEMARNGDLQIWTSTYTLAEVFKRKCEDIPAGLPDTKDVVFEDFLSQDFVVYAQVDADVGTLARRLLRRYSELKKPPDAVHLATAILHNCDEFHTTDGENLLPLNGRISRLDRTLLLICRPPDPPPPAPKPAQQELFPPPQGSTDPKPAREAGVSTEQETDAPVSAGGEGTGLPGGRSHVRPTTEADSGNGGDAEEADEEGLSQTDARPPTAPPVIEKPEYAGATAVASTFGGHSSAAECGPDASAAGRQG